MLVADYNGDGRPDAFVACHGIDTPPCPDEQSTVVPSQSDGSYAISKASVDIGFFHGANTIDADGDGKPDVIVTGFGGSTGDIGLLINQGDGSFRRDPSWRLNSFAVFQHFAWPSLTQTVAYRDTRNDRGLPRLIATTINGNAVVSSDLADGVTRPLN